MVVIEDRGCNLWAALLSAATMNKLKDFASIRDAQAIGASDNMRVGVVECLVRIPSLKGFDDLLVLGHRFPRPRVLRAVHLDGLHDDFAEIQMQIAKQADPRKFDDQLMKFEIGLGAGLEVHVPGLNS